MSNKIKLGEFVYPHEFRAMSEAMVEKYKELEKIDTDIASAKEWLKKNDKPYTLYISILDSKYFDIALKVSIVLRFIAVIAMIVISWEFHPLLAILCIILPILILNTKLFEAIFKLITNYPKKKKKAQQKGKEDWVREKEETEEKLKSLESKRKNAVQAAKEHQDLYEVWKDQLGRLLRVYSDAPYIHERSEMTNISGMIEAIKSVAASMAVKPVEIAKPVTIEPVTAAVAQPNVAVKEVQGSAKNNVNEEKGQGENKERQSS